LSKPTYNKPALTFEGQLDQKLIPRGLIVEDRDRALRWLGRVGYYRLSGYLYPYRVSPVDDNFRPSASFDTAVSVYKFDSQLRLLLLQAIDRIEVAMRTSVTYHLSHALGPFGHMDQNHFKPYVPATTTSDSVGLDFAEFKRKAKNDERQSSEEFVGHYRNKYDNDDLPIWMLTEVISFGTLSRITENLQDKQIQRRIARDFALSQTQLISWMRCLCYIRNLCAHHSRIWNRPISVKPELLPKWRIQGITRDRLHVVLLVMLHLLQEIAPDCGWKGRMADHLLSNMEVSLSAMHLPDDWYRREPWKLI
jgi:abortive infection bacteriophage resistance protein